MICPRCARDNPETAGQCAACGAVLSLDNATLTGLGTAPPARAGTGARGGDRTMTGSGLASTGAGRPGFAPTARLEPGTLLGTRYEILDVLGEGGMGTVYKAQDRELGRLVALKVIRPEMAARPEILERFKREILLASQVTHRNVLRIHDLGEAGEIRFISMSYVEGSDLKALLEREGALSLDRGLPLIRQIGEALQAAHDAGIVHRDLKPQNILIDREGNAYISDFGISRSLAEGGTMTETGTILGTVDYMSPEQARGETPDHRGDIYSFGVILYEMFTGSLPFRASNALSVMMKRLHEDAPTIQKARPGLPAWLSAIVARAMRREPQDRYASARDLLRDLDRQRASRSWRRLARPRYLVPVAAAVLVAVLGTLLQRGVIPWRSPESAGTPPRTSLVVLRFRNATGDTRYDWVGTGLPSLVYTELIEVKSLRLVGQDRAEEILQTLKVPAESDPGADTIRRVSALLGAEHVLSGRLLKIADRLRIEASLQSGLDTSPQGETVAATAQNATSLVVDGKGDQAIFSMVDDLSRQVRDSLGLSRGFMEKSSGSVDLTTRSVEALGMYSEALALGRAGNQMDAAKKLEGAVEKDPKFSVARALLAETYDRLGYSDKAVAEINKAVAGIGPVSAFEATRIRAVQARLKSDPDLAVKSYRHLCEIAPNSADVFYDLAAAQEDSDDLKGALQSLQRVVALDPKHPSAHYVLGRVNYKLGNQAEAIQEFTAALSLHAETGNEEGRATVLNGLGNAYSGMGKQDEGIKYYRDSLEIRRRIGDQRGVRVVLDNIAQLQAALGHTTEAIAAATEAVTIATTIGDRQGQADANSELGDIYQSAGRPEEALRVYQEGLKILRETNDDVSLARSLSNVGYINIVLGRYVEAYFFLKEALEKRRQTGIKEEIVRSLIDIGVLEQIQGRYEEALKYNTEGGALARGSSNAAGTAVLLLNLSNIQEDQGDYGPALSTLAEAEKAARDMNDAHLIATSLLYEGSVRRCAGDLAGSEQALAEALRLSRDLKNTPLIAEALTYQAGLYDAKGQRQQAASVSREAVAAARDSRDVRLGLLAGLQAADSTASLPGIERVAKEAESSGLRPIAARARLALARHHDESGRNREAFQESKLAIEIASPLNLRDILLQARDIAGRSMKKQGNAEEAARQFEAGLAALEEMRRSMQGDVLSHFLKRRETSDFARDAEATFRAASLTQAGDRLASLLRP